jgi:hypothetical protein
VTHISVRISCASPLSYLAVVTASPSNNDHYRLRARA